ncbi:MAG: hypothetical protein AAF483_03645 [Planctomycetota bacterium]
MPQFRCPSCNKTLKADEKHAGKQVKCPCGQQLQVPFSAKKSQAPASAAPSATPPSPAPAKDYIQIQCTCGKVMKTPASAAGKTVRCPGCQATLQVPGGPTAAPAPAAAPDPFGTSDPYAAGGMPDLSSDFSNQQDDWLGALPPADNAPASALQQDFYAGSGGGGGGASPYSNSATSSKKASANRYLAQAEEDIVRQESYAAQQEPEEGSMWDAGAITGILMMLGAVVWFVGGLAVGYIFFYPPILFIAGLFSFARALFD